MKRLVALPILKSFEIALKGIRVRFFRSLITTMSLVLAIAFLTFTWVSDDIAQSIFVAGDPDLLTKLARLGYDIGLGDTGITASPKQRWIVFLSLLVCVVGIINAQIMSVTERFREIGTMKCLGALDIFVVRIFIIEAGLQGIAGSTAGAVAGALTAIVAGLVRFGTAALRSIPLNEISISVGLAIITGTILSLLGVLYPAIIAARMQPVEAMRVEQ